MFSRKKKAEEADLDEVFDDDVDEELDDEVDEDFDDEFDDEPDELDEEDEEELIEDAEPLDEWQALDASRDWREDGPFDINEVDLDADDVQRLDFGSLVVTPFDGMQLQMQVNQDEVQSLLVVDGKSSIEIVLFAAPLRSSMLANTRAEMQAATKEAGGTMKLAEGPLGTEIRRSMPGERDGKRTNQASRTWLAQGPRWLLRGTVTGQAALTDSVDEGEAQLLFEFFCNLVVRRGERPLVPGTLIALEVPDTVADRLSRRRRK